MLKFTMYLVNDKTNFEIGEITKKVGLTEKSKVLDIGTKTGDEVPRAFKKRNQLFVLTTRSYDKT